MFDEKEDELLQAILNELQSDEYEIGRYVTVGGASGAYSVRSPYNTECEYAVACCFGSANGIALVSGSNSSIAAPPTDGSVSFGLAANGTDTNALDGIVLGCGAYVATTPDLVWQPLPSPGNVTAAITAASSHSCYVTLIFRRKLARFIPVPPRAKPAHMHVQSRRNGRTFAQAFANREEVGLKGEN